MNTATPSVAQNNAAFVSVPKKIYKDFLAWQKSTKRQNTFEAAAEESKAIEQSQQDIRQGKWVAFSEL